jgi:hypothetical protein
VRWPWMKSYIVKCPDGSTRAVMYNIDDAFPLHISTESSRKEGGASASLEGPQLTAQAKTEYETKVQSLIFALDEKNQSLMMSFRSVYMVFVSNPCANSDYLKREVEKLLDEQRSITRLRTRIRGLIDLVNSSPKDTQIILDTFKEISGDLGDGGIAEAAKIEIVETRRIAKALTEGDK